MITFEIYTELVKFRDGLVSNSDGPTDMLDYLEDQNYIRHTKSSLLHNGMAILPVEWEITEPGRVALSEFECRRDQETKREVHQRRQEHIGIAQTVVPAVTFLLGLLVEHVTGIVEFIFSLFR